MWRGPRFQQSSLLPLSAQFLHLPGYLSQLPFSELLVVPDSGSGQLEGLAGTMTIKIEGGKHSYEFDYTLAGTSE